MNLFELQERLKDFSQDQLVNEMRSPSGSAPQYLVLSELQRRKRIMQQEQAQMPQQQSTVAEDAVAAAGMPQGGLAQMAQALAPQTDMVQNTARMADGGMTRFPTFDDAGTDEFDEYLIIENIRRGAIPADEALPGGMSDELRDELARRRAIYTGRKAEGGEVRRMDEGGLADITPDVKAYGVSEFLRDPRVLEAALRSGMEPYDYLQRLNEEQISYLRDTPIAESGQVIRDEYAIETNDLFDNRYDGPGGAFSLTDRRPPDLAPVGLSASGMTGVEAVPTVSSEDIQRMADENRIDESDAAFSVLGAGLDAPIADLRRYLSSIEDSDGTSPLQGPSPTPYADLLGSPSIIESISGDIPPLQGPMPQAAPALGADDARARRTAAYVEENLARDALGLPEREFAGLSDSALAQILNDSEEASTSSRMTDNELANLEYAGIDMSQPTGPGIGFEDMARGLFGDEAIDAVARNREIGRERERTQELASQFEGEAEAADAEIAALERAAIAEQFEAEGEVADAEARRPVIDLTAQREGAGGGGAGGGAGGAGGGMSGDDLYEQDKWLALAQFGLGLMSSQAPTFGQAIGEAGTAGISALRQAREEQQGRQAAAQARSDRLAAAAARGQREEAPEYPYRQVDDLMALADAYQSQALSIAENLGGVPTEDDPEYEDYINSLAAANTYRNDARQAMGIQ